MSEGENRAVLDRVLVFSPEEGTLGRVRRTRLCAPVPLWFQPGALLHSLEGGHAEGASNRQPGYDDYL